MVLALPRSKILEERIAMEEEEEEEYAWNFLVREQYLQWCNLFHALFLIFFRFLQKVMNIINIIAS
jgi:hypothetical protein